MKKKKGFTLMESVVTLALCIIMSMSLLTICINSIKSTDRSFQKFTAANFATDMLKYYQLSLGTQSLNADYADMVNFYEERTTLLQVGEEQTFTFDNKSVKYVTVINKVDLSFEFVAYWSSENEELYTLSWRYENA